MKPWSGYSGDANSVTIYLANDTVTKDSYYIHSKTGIQNQEANYQDSFSDVQKFIGETGADTVVFDGSSNQYTIVHNRDGSITVTDTVANRDRTHQLDDIPFLQFTDQTLEVLNLSQAAATSIPAVTVEGSMYGMVGSSAEVTSLVTNFLPAQVANAMANGFNPQVYACEALGLVFAFGNENGGMAFDTNIGPANTAMPATPAGDAAFAAAAASTIFGSAATANTPVAILGFVTNWEAFYTAHGIPGIANATANQIDLAARGAAWGDAVGVALADNLGPLHGQAVNFLADAAQGTAHYSASLASQPTATPFQGSTAVDSVLLIGVGANHNAITSIDLLA